MSLSAIWYRLSEVWSSLLRMLVPWFLVISLVSGLMYQRLYDNAVDPLNSKLHSATSEANKAISRHLSGVQRDALFLARHDALRDYASQPNSKRLLNVEALFVAFSEASALYDQVRWINNSGVELVRTNWIGKNAITVPPNELQTKSRRYYVIESLKLQPGEFYLSALDLNVENNRVEQPYKPVIRVATPVVSKEGEKNGVLVLNFLAKPLLRELREISERVGIELSLLNNDGYWLLAPDEQDAWGFMFQRKELRLAERDPESWSVISSAGSKIFENSNGLWQVQTYKIGGANSSSRIWKLVGRIPSSELKVISRVSAVETILLALGLLLAAIVACVRIAFAMHDRDFANQCLETRKQELEQSNEALETSLQRLRETQDELVQAGKLSSLGMMVAGVAHELNTPLGAALVTLSRLQTENNKLQDAFESGLKRSDVEAYFACFAEGADIMRRNLQRSAELVSTFKRLAVDRTQEDRRQFGLVELVDDLCNTSWLRLKRQSHILQIDISADLQLYSFPGALGQVLENLVSNAVFHAYQDNVCGSVRVIGVRAAEGTSALIKVEDDGVGIKPEILPKIFDPFFTTCRGRGGTGLGLYLVHQLVTGVLGGTIAVESIVDRGTCFTLEIPLSCEISMVSAA